ncbi:hypothetical protein ILUMI_01193 [Ignelater luminosus]|uniref:Uncharacterized protein n=1 Tax=Ignelater luminosus TaxID=2038154 RepID=A0A8K0DK60_IGNLU|nr:hypothetical protein ILUMI_01193 [Ignelater luminosus]
MSSRTPKIFKALESINPLETDEQVSTIVQVCQTFFLKTLDILQTFVSTTLSKKLTGGMVETAKRGRKIPPNKISIEVRDSIR